MWHSQLERERLYNRELSLSICLTKLPIADFYFLRVSISFTTFVGTESSWLYVALAIGARELV